MKNTNKKLYLYLLLLSLSPTVYAQHSDCVHEAAQCFKINPLIIKAIIWQESNNRQHVVNINTNKTLDVGIMQVNSIHFKILKSQGISERELRENSCTNIFSGTWILNQVIKDNGYSWEGIGRYHSKTPHYRDRYVSRLIAILRYDKKKIDKIQIPYQNGIREKFPCS